MIRGTEYWPYNHKCTSSYDVFVFVLVLFKLYNNLRETQVRTFFLYVFFLFSELIRAFMQERTLKEVLQTQVYDSKAWKFIALAKFIYSCLRQIC